MNNTIPRIICSDKNCNKVFSQEWDEYGFSYFRLGTLPIDDDDKLEKNMVCFDENTNIL